MSLLLRQCTNQLKMIRDYGNLTTSGSIQKALENVFANAEGGKMILGCFFFNGQFTVFGFKYQLGNYGYIDAKCWDGTHWFLSYANGAFSFKNDNTLN